MAVEQFPGPEAFLTKGTLTTAPGPLGDLTLSSNFQPILSLSHQRIVGFEALLRAADKDGHAKAPLEVFRDIRGREEAAEVDKICLKMHMRNFIGWDTQGCWLFLNINPQSIEADERGLMLLEAVEASSLPPHRIVVEILEAAMLDDRLLSKWVARCRALGCLIAIDDFGAGHSNFDRIFRLHPDIVKIDRTLVEEAAANKEVGAIIPGMVSLLHQSGALVVMEGIETQQQAMIAMSADADFVQGYFFARPMPNPSHVSIPRFSSLFEQYQAAAAREEADFKTAIGAYVNAVGYSSVLLQGKRPFEVACRGFLELPRAERCYLLDGNGMQIGASCVASAATQTDNQTYGPLSDAHGANWSRRHYFRRAVSHPEKVQVSRPYLSIASAAPCVTASIAFKVDGKLRVLCGDIKALAAQS